MVGNTHVKFGRDRRGVVSLVAALASIALLTASAVGIEVAHWSEVTGVLQRAADMGSLAGVAGLAKNDTTEQAANEAATIAEINGAVGTTTRNWNPTTLVLTDNQVTVSVVNGIRNPSDPAIKVAIVQPTPMLFGRLITSSTSISLGAVAVAELGPQPCILTLGGNGIRASGGPVIDLNGCSAYSDSNISMTGSVTFDTSAADAAGNISIGSNVSGTGTNPAIQASGLPSIADPYAGDSAVQSALAAAACQPAITPQVSNGTMTLYPNTCYGSISVSGSEVLAFSQPGLYLINGNLKVSGNSGTTVSGSGITIAATGSVSITGNFNNNAVTLTAASVETAQNGAIPGVLLATDSSLGSSIGGGVPIPFTGLIYMPNANVSFAGTPTSGSTGCAKLIANSVTIVGNSTLATACSSYQLSTFGNSVNTNLLELVQ